MRRRRFLTLAGVVSLAGCSGGEPTETASPAGGDTPTASTTAPATTAPTADPPASATRTPEDGTPTAPAVDTARADEALSAARSQLATAVAEFEGDAVPLSEVASAFAYDRAVVDDATAAAESEAATAAEVGDDEQVAAAEAYLALAAGLRALADAHTDLLAAAAGVRSAADLTASESYDAAIAALADARAAAAAVPAALETARSRLGTFERAVVDPRLSDPVTADIEAGVAVHAYLAALAAGRHARVSGLVDTEAGIDAFRSNEYGHATSTFAAAYIHFEDAIDATEGYESELMAGVVAEELCLAEEYRGATETMQSGSLEADAGNENEGFELYREGLSQYRNAPRRC